MAHANVIPVIEYFTWIFCFARTRQFVGFTVVAIVSRRFCFLNVGFACVSFFFIWEGAGGGACCLDGRGVRFFPDASRNFH